MVMPPLPVQAISSVTVSDLKTLRQLAESGQLKTWQAGALLDVVVNRRDGGLLMVDTGKGLIGLPVPEGRTFTPGTALQLQVLALAPLQIQLRPAPPSPTPGSPLPTLATLPVMLPASGGALPNTVPPLAPGPPPLLAAGAPAAMADSVSESDPVGSLVRLFSARLATLPGPGSPETLQTLPARLGEWLSRQAAAASTQPDTSPATGQRPTAAEWARLGSTLLGQWPDQQQASEPDELTHLLRQALFGTPTATTAETAAKPSADWLGSLARLLFALPASPLANTPSAAAANAGTAANSTAQLPNKDDDKPASLSSTLPLPDDLVEELAQVLGRQQQHWLNNLQADARQQPLYAELLLQNSGRHSERNGEPLTPFELSIREEDHGAGNDRADARHHVVRLRFDLPGLGCCQFLLDLNADDLQLHFYSERDDTVALFDQHLDELARTLAADAIHLTTVQSHRVEQLPHLQQNKESGFHVRV